MSKSDSKFVIALLCLIVGIVGEHKSGAWIFYGLATGHVCWMAYLNFTEKDTK